MDVDLILLRSREQRPFRFCSPCSSLHPSPLLIPLFLLCNAEEEEPPCMNRSCVPEWKSPWEIRERERWGGADNREIGREQKSTCRCPGPRGPQPGSSSHCSSSRSSNNRLCGVQPACLTHWLTHCTRVSHEFYTYTSVLSSPKIAKCTLDPYTLSHR